MRDGADVERSAPLLFEFEDVDFPASFPLSSVFFFASLSFSGSSIETSESDEAENAGEPSKFRTGSPAWAFSMKACHITAGVVPPASHWFRNTANGQGELSA